MSGVMENLVGRAEDRAKELELLAEDLVGEPLRLIVGCQEVDDRDVALLRVAVTPADALCANVT
jgi:hypothetical protein